MTVATWRTREVVGGSNMNYLKLDVLKFLEEINLQRVVTFRKESFCYCT